MFILSVVFVGLAAVGLATGILVRKNGKFPNIHVSGNRHLRKQGVTCVQDFDRSEQKEAKKKDVYRKLRPVGKA
jgi:hypothetical protein